MASPCRANTWNLRSTRLWDELEQSSVRTLLHQRKELEDSSTLEKAKLRHETQSSKKKSLKLTAEHAKLEGWVKYKKKEFAALKDTIKNRDTEIMTLQKQLSELQEASVLAETVHAGRLQQMQGEHHGLQSQLDEALHASSLAEEHERAEREASTQVQHLTDALERATHTAKARKDKQTSVTSLVVELIDMQLIERRHSIDSLQQLLRSLPGAEAHSKPTKEPDAAPGQVTHDDSDGGDGEQSSSPGRSEQDAND